ncbi:hypothetical protein [uncultured Clostridium sp.]|uniref:hypothetical protein n=1 Tax=uncultured Clostridium sp. TaxID=59620 RepID=UPI0032176109
MKRKLFINGENPDERAYIGWQDKSLSLQGIKMGYKNSADNLVKIALKEGKRGRIDILDSYIFPILFFYRHSIEISLKHVYFRFNGTIPKGNHNLLNLWDRLDKDVFSQLSSQVIIDDINKNYNINLKTFFIEEREKTNIKELLKELQGRDVHGDVWRYLIDKGGNLYFTEWDYIDYRNLKSTLSWIYDEIEGIYCYIDNILSI